MIGKGSFSHCRPICLSFPQAHKSLSFVKVEGHSGLEENERADALAREAIRKHVKGRGRS